MLFSTSGSALWPNLCLSILNLLLCLRCSCGSDVFCGNLTVYQRKWSSEDTVVLATRRADDLKQCLHACCNLSDCQGVTFIGVVDRTEVQENCLLIKCNGGCQVDAISAELSGGVSVEITRAVQNFTLDGSRSLDNLSLPSTTDEMLHNKLTPIWAIGLVIVVSVFCVGCNIILISAYICWQRKKNVKRKAHISTIRTLHAFNPA